MEKFVLIIHSLSALIIIGLILLQQGKGAAAGASFGSGASQTVFGSEGGGSFFTRATAIFAAIFFCTSVTLAVMAKNRSTITTIDSSIPVQTAPAPVSDIPAVQPTAPASDIPVAPAEPAK